METKVGVLAIGSEVVEGQIVNRNAAWLSERMEEIGAKSLFHLSARDKHDEIVAALNFLSSHCHLILVSGGLGPTKDDFTRQTLSQWLGAPLELNESEWKGIQEKLTRRKLTLREGHKNQALIPSGATVLPNSKGVAPGFFIKSPQCFLAALPGPPNEMQPMYKDHLKELITSNLSPKSDYTLKTWICFLAPESEVAHITESILGDSVELGYRLHRPYVEVKAWVPKDVSPDLLKRFQLLEEKLGDYFIGHSIKEIRNSFHSKISQYETVYVVDHLTSGLFLEKVKEDAKPAQLRYQCFEHKAFRFFSEDEVTKILQITKSEWAKNSLMISLFPETEFSYFISYNDQVLRFQLPRMISVNSKLGQYCTIEQCFLSAPQNL